MFENELLETAICALWKDIDKTYGLFSLAKALRELKLIYNSEPCTDCLDFLADIAETKGNLRLAAVMADNWIREQEALLDNYYDKKYGSNDNGC